MGKAERVREMKARERIAAQQAAARRAETRRRLFLGGGSILVVIAVVVGLVIARNVTSSHKAAAVSTAAQVSQVTSALSSIPASALDTAGAGSNITPPKATPDSTAVLTSGGKPEIVYLGAEYCPFCAAERWSMVVALSRFGTFSGLGLTQSSSTDTDPNTPTLTFYKSSYTSQYLVFDSAEMQDRSSKTLQNPTAAESALLSKWDVAPYTSQNGAIPFIDIGNKYILSGSQFDPATLAGLSWTQVAADVKDPTSTVGKEVLGAANMITAAICKITPNAPTSVCTSPGVTAAAGAL